MSRYRLSHLAEQDLIEIWLYVAREANSAVASHLIDEITERFALLADYPEAGRLRNELAPNLRSFPVQNYVIYYRPSRTAVLIARILHGKRDQETALDLPISGLG